MFSYSFLRLDPTWARRLIRPFVIAVAAAISLAGCSGVAMAQQAGAKPSAGMLRYPDVSKTHIVFSYAGDLWTVSRDGGTATPLASPAGQELFPRFNRGGDRIAFVGNYDGDRDLYTIDANGGDVTRMTYHPADEVLCDWTADDSLLFSSNGMAGLGRVSQLFTVSIDEPFPQQVGVPYGTNGTISDDGKWLAYTPHSRDTRTWKRYRGGMASDVWLYNLESNVSKKVTDWEGTDSLPMWHGKKLYYLSDNGDQQRLNIWEYDISADSHRQVTDFADFDCKWPSIGPGADGNGEIVLQNGADLWLINLATGEKSAVTVTIPGDRPNVRERMVDVKSFIQSGDVSPNGKRAVVEARGDLWTLPIKNGTARNLTDTDGVAERMPSWSPDGRWIAYFSDATGEYELYVTQSDGRGETKQLTKDGKAWRYNPVWSPDSKHIVFTDKAGHIYLHTIDGDTKRVDTDPYAGSPNVDWSHDSGWLTYSRTLDQRYQTSAVFVYNVEKAEVTRLTEFFPCSNPVFSRDGNYIYCSSNAAFNAPKYEDVGSTFIYSGTQVLLAIPLRADVKHPQLPKVDEVEWKEEEKKADQEKDKGADKDEASGDKASDDNDDDDEGSDDSDDADDSDDQENGDDDQDDGLSGSWSGTASGEGLPQPEVSMTMSLTFNAADGTVSGSVSSDAGSFDVSGLFDPKTGKLSLGGDLDGIGIDISGTVKDGSFEGTAVADGGALTLKIQASRQSQGGEGAQEDDGDDKDADKKKKGKDKDKAKDKKVEIEFDGIQNRMFRLPVPQGNFGALAVNDKNQLIYARRGSRGGGGRSSINLFDLKDEKQAEKKILDGGGNFGISANHKKLLVFRGDTLYLIDAAAGQKLDKKYQTGGMKAMINPRDEWKQVFMDAWRVERDFFYDPTMHGTDWVAIRDHYMEMIDDCSSRQDLGFVIGEMISEINVGHAYYRPGPGANRGPAENVGLLGCRFSIEDGRYKIDEVFEGAAWDTDARNPLRAVGIKEGDFILQVDGRPLTAEQNLYSAFVGLAGMTVNLTVSTDSKLDDDDQRVAVKLLSNDNNLRFRHWIEKNRQRIDEKTDGKVGYIYVVNTGVPGQNDLFRQFYGQAGKEALIIDDRWNGGGQIPNRFIELLNRPTSNQWARRDGRDWSWPPDSHQGPKCMLINGMAGSGGDMFPSLFKQHGLGKLIGMRTWGGLVGISGGPQMIDGSSVTAPSFAYYDNDGTWGIEGHGVDPDMEVVDDPAKMLDGADPQLDAAIAHMLEEIKENGFKAPKRPAYPDRRKIGIAEEDK